MSEITLRHKCSSCQCEEQIVISLSVGTAEPADPYLDWLTRLSPEEQKIVKQMDAGGLTKSYAAAAKVKLAAPPKNAAKALLSWLRCATPMALSPAIRLVLMQTFGRDRNVEVLQANRVLGFVVDSALSMFAPRSVLHAAEMQLPGKPAIGELVRSAQAIGDWIKTRNGYVPREAGLFVTEMRKKRPGHFAREGRVASR